MAASISILLPTYNGAAFLDEQLQSLSDQTFGDFEILAVDDGSSDSTRDLLLAYQRREPRLRVLPARANRGHKASLVELAEASAGRWIAICDQDDVWEPDKLAILVAAIGNASLAFGRSELIDQTGRLYGRTLLETMKSPAQPDNRLRLLFRPQVSAHAMLARRELLVPQAFASDEPFDWLISLLAAFTGGIVYRDDAVVRHRLHASNSHNTDILQLFKPSKLRVRHVRLALAHAERCRKRLVNGLSFLAVAHGVAPDDRQAFGKLAARCRSAWSGRSPERPRDLRRAILEGLRPFAGSAEDLMVARANVTLAAFGLVHPETLRFASRLRR